MKSSIRRIYYNTQLAPTPAKPVRTSNTLGQLDVIGQITAMGRVNIKYPYTRARFIFLNSGCQSTNPANVYITAAPIGVSYFADNIPVKYKGIGYVNYLGCGTPCPLELGTSVSFNSYLISDSMGRGIVSNRTGLVQEGYAISLESGAAGDIIMVLPTLVSIAVYHEFSNGFNWADFR